MGNSRTASMQESSSGTRSRPTPGGSGSAYDQASDAMSGVAGRASDLWDDAYDQGQRYYRQGSRAIGALDSAAFAGLIAAGALGFAIAWMMFSHRTDWVAQRMSESNERRR